jgi:hypothetical protein
VSLDIDAPSEPRPRNILRPVIRIPGPNASELTYPRSQYVGWTAPMQPTPEAEAVAYLAVSVLVESDGNALLISLIG